MHLVPYRSNTFESAVHQASLRSIAPYVVGNTQHPLTAIYFESSPGLNLGFFYNWQQFFYNLTMFWVTVDEPPKEAENYQYKLEILDPQDHSKCLFKAERPCVSCDVSHADMKHARAILLDKALLERASEEDESSFVWRLTIEKK